MQCFMRNHPIAAGKSNLENNLLRKCGLLAHTSAAFLKNCCTEKLFSLPAALIHCNQKSRQNHYQLFCRDLLYDSIVSGI